MIEYQDNGAKAKAPLLIAVTWSLFLVAASVFAARIIVRFKFSKRLFIDDGWACFALCCLLANAILTQVMLKSMYVTVSMQKFSAVIKRDEQVNFLVEIPFFLKLQFAQTMVFWTCLWSVKASFLAFFRRLTENLKGHIIAWWIIVAITILAYIGCVITYPVSCSDFSPLGCTKPINVRLALVSLRYSTSVDVATDLMIIALPMSLAWRVKLPMKTRFALFGVFSLGGLIILFAILRIVYTNTPNRQPEISWLNLWSAIEASVACIVCNLAPFKVLFQGRIRNYASDPYQREQRYAREEKVTPFSHELSSSEGKSTLGKGSSIVSSVPEAVYPRHPAVYPIRQKSTLAPARRNSARATMHTQISAARDPFDKDIQDGTIMVTREVNRKEIPIEQLSMTTLNTAEEEKMRTMWTERSSNESLQENLIPRTVSRSQTQNFSRRGMTM